MLVANTLAAEEYPSCVVEGRPVQYLLVSPSSPLLNGQFAIATYMDEKRSQKYGYKGYVTIVSTYVSQLPYVIRQHIYAHECAHHLLGHSKQSFTYNPLKYLEGERQADCRANELLKAQNFTHEQFNQMLIEMAKYQTMDRVNEVKNCNNMQ